jgi:hypothetical protein
MKREKNSFQQSAQGGFGATSDETSRHNHLKA